MIESRVRFRHLHAIWIISHGVVSDELKAGTLKMLPVDTSETRGPLGLTMRTDTQPSAAFSILLKTIREAAAERG